MAGGVDLFWSYLILTLSSNLSLQLLAVKQTILMPNTIQTNWVLPCGSVLWLSAGQAVMIGHRRRYWSEPLICTLIDSEQCLNQWSYSFCVCYYIDSSLCSEQWHTHTHTLGWYMEWLRGTQHRMTLEHSAALLQTAGIQGRQSWSNCHFFSALLTLRLCIMCVCTCSVWVDACVCVEELAEGQCLL